MTVTEKLLDYALTGERIATLLGHVLPGIARSLANRSTKLVHLQA